MDRWDFGATVQFTAAWYKLKKLSNCLPFASCIPELQALGDTMQEHKIQDDIKIKQKYVFYKII